MTWLQILVVMFAIPPVLATLLSLVGRNAWWYRSFDFPRLQIASWAGVAFVGLWWVRGNPSIGLNLLLCALLGVFVWQVYKIFPYTPLAVHEVHSAHESDSSTQPTLSLMVSNVLMSCRNSEKLLNIVRKVSPDVVLFLEPDHWWQKKLAVLYDSYPHRVEQPQENRYGMLLFSRWPLDNPTIQALVRPEVPSIHTRVMLQEEIPIQLYCLHPEPPAPDEATTSTRRDVELLLVGEQVKDHTLPCIVMGDLNDVAWSYTTTLFQKTSGLVDPRKGRGMYNTFHAWYPWMRFPLDHIFHSPDFQLIELQRLPSFGSDHFPVLVRLLYNPSENDNRAPEMTPEDAQNKADKFDDLRQEERDSHPS